MVEEGGVSKAAFRVAFDGEALASRTMNVAGFGASVDGAKRSPH